MGHILVIDDDNQIRALLRTILEKEGYEVVEARDGREGLEQCRQGPVDLVITDMFMPDMDGGDTILQLREEFQELRIIAISGGAAGREAMLGLNVANLLGARYTFAKPFDTAKLLDAVRELVDEVG